MRERSAMAKQNSDQQPGRSSSEAAFNELKREIAARNEAAHKEARALRAVRDREQILARRRRDLL
jgi:hypothetical protein